MGTFGRPSPNQKRFIMKQYDVKTVDGVDFIYIGNDVNGNCKYAISYRDFLKKSEAVLPFQERLNIARKRAKSLGAREKGSIEPYFVVKPCGNLYNYADILWALHKID